jgi:hypothetical protein
MGDFTINQNDGTERSSQPHIEGLGKVKVVFLL